MSKIAIICDTHLGARNDSPVIARQISKFFNNVFFPYLRENNIKTMIHLGDVVDRRKHINFLSLNQLHRDFLKPAEEQDVDTYLIAGNHDCYYKNTNKINALDEVLAHSHYENLVISVDHTRMLHVEGTDILLCPWISPENRDRLLDDIKHSKAQVLMGHFEIKGFEMQKGQICEGGLTRDLFAKFDCVFSGHFHQQSQQGNIRYLGAPYEMTWADADQPRGFHIFNSKTRELEFISNPHKVFQTIEYDDSAATIHDIEEMEVDNFADCFVKVRVSGRDNPEIYDLFLEKMNKSGAAEVKVIEPSLNVVLNEDQETLEGEQDTPSIISNYVKQLEMNADKKEVEKLLLSLYREAISL